MRQMRRACGSAKCSESRSSSTRPPSSGQAHTDDLAAGGADGGDVRQLVQDGGGKKRPEDAAEVNIGQREHERGECGANFKAPHR